MMDCNAVVYSISALAEADLGQLLALHCMVVLKSFVLVQGQWLATPCVQNVGRFDKSDTWLHYKPGAHHVIVSLGNFKIKGALFSTYSNAPLFPPSPSRG
jgi:hypothetical protein